MGDCVDFGVVGLGDDLQSRDIADPNFYDPSAAISFLREGLCGRLQAR